MPRRITLDDLDLPIASAWCDLRTSSGNASWRVFREWAEMERRLHVPPLEPLPHVTAIDEWAFRLHRESLMFKELG